MRYSVVSIEDGIVIIEDENGLFRNMDASELPDSLKEGQILDFDENGFFINREETSAQRQRIFETFNFVKNSKK